MVIWPTSPLAGPSPWVTLVGALLMPFTTVFRTEPLGFSRLVLKTSVPRLPSRVAVSTSTSDGELTRVGTFPDGGFESFGKTSPCFNWLKQFTQTTLQPLVDLNHALVMRPSSGSGL